MKLKMSSFYCQIANLALIFVILLRSVIVILLLLHCLCLEQKVHYTAVFMLKLKPELSYGNGSVQKSFISKCLLMVYNAIYESVGKVIVIWFLDYLGWAGHLTWIGGTWSFFLNEIYAILLRNVQNLCSWKSEDHALVWLAVEIVIGTNTLFPFTALTPLHDLNQFHITMFASLLSFYMMLLDDMDASFFFFFFFF